MKPWSLDRNGTTNLILWRWAERSRPLTVELWNSVFFPPCSFSSLVWMNEMTQATYLPIINREKGFWPGVILLLLPLTVFFGDPENLGSRGRGGAFGFSQRSGEMAAFSMPLGARKALKFTAILSQWLTLVITGWDCASCRWSGDPERFYLCTCWTWLFG